MFENHKSANIGKWLNFDLTSERLCYEIFLEYNPEYPGKTERIIKYV